MAYVPPHLRNNSTPSGGTTQANEKHDTKEKTGLDDTSESFTSIDVVNHFWPGTDALERPDHSKTLHGSAARPDELAFILLFAGANPQWASEQLVYTKSNLELLPTQKLRRRKSYMQQKWR